MTDNRRPLRVFLCHASGDKPAVRKLYERLTDDGVDAWLDKEKLIPGQNWQIEIPKAVRNSDVVIVCLSSSSISKEGFVQREIKFALDIADEKPEDTIFIIPARLEDCDIPDRINKFHWVDLFAENGYEQLLKALFTRANSLNITISKNRLHEKKLAITKTEKQQSIFSNLDNNPIPKVNKLQYIWNKIPWQHWLAGCLLVLPVLAFYSFHFFSSKDFQPSYDELFSGALFLLGMASFIPILWFIASKLRPTLTVGLGKMIVIGLSCGLIGVILMGVFVGWYRDNIAGSYWAGVMVAPFLYLVWDVAWDILLR